MRKPKKILVIDDEPDFHSLFSRILEQEGYVVISAYSGEEALEKLTYENFDLVILDLVLPPNKKTGLETLEEIRKINSKYQANCQRWFKMAKNFISDSR